MTEVTVNTNERRYDFLLDKIEQQQQIIGALIKAQQSQNINLNQVKKSMQSLETELQKEGYGSTNNVQNSVKQIQNNAQQISKKFDPEAVFQQSKGMIFGMAKSMIMWQTMGWIFGALGTAFLFVKRFLFGEGDQRGFISTLGGLLQNHGVTIGVAALLFALGWLLLKNYEKIVNKAKEVKNKKQQPTREEINIFMNSLQNNSIILNEHKMLAEFNMSIEKQQTYLERIKIVCNNALDVLSAGLIGGSFFIALTTALTPLIFATAIGAFLWTTLFLTKKVLDNKTQTAVSTN